MLEHRQIQKSLHKRQAEAIDALATACERLIERLEDAWPQNQKDKDAIEAASAALRMDRD